MRACSSTSSTARAWRPATSHLLMSVTKSVVGTVAGILCEQGLLAADDLVTRYVPELGAERVPRRHRPRRARHALGSAVRRGLRGSRRAMSAGWRRRSAGGPGSWARAPGLHRFLCELRRRSPARRTVRLPLVRDRRPGLGVRAGVGRVDAGPHLRRSSGGRWVPSTTRRCSATPSAPRSTTAGCPASLRATWPGSASCSWTAGSRRGSSGRSARLVRRRLVGGRRGPAGLRGLPRGGLRCPAAGTATSSG